MNSHPTVVPFLLLVAATTLSAQDPVTTRELPPGPTSVRQSTAIEQRGNHVFAGGFDYEATLDGTGMRFVPALGMAAASTQQLALRLRAVGRASAPIPAAALTAQPAIAGHQVSYPRGETMRERYDVTPAGLQLSWHFATPPAGTGDLVVHYDLDTTLPLAAAAAGTLSFHLPGIGGVGIGAVTGIDALGRRIAGELRLHEKVLELRLAAAFVDEAAYPLVLDPLIGTQFLAETGGWNDSASDVAYDATNDMWLVVFRRVFSAASQAIRAQRISGAGALVGSFLSLVSTINVNHPTVANLNLRDTFVVAWQQAPSMFEPYDIVCLSVNAATGATSVATSIAAAAGDEIHPDATGDNTTSDDEAMIAYEQPGAGIKIASVTVAAAGAQPTLQGTTVVTTNTAASNPAISKSQPSATTYAIVWTDVSGLNTRLRARALNRNGSLLGSEITVTTGSTLLGTGPGNVDVDGNGTEFLVVYDFTETAATNGERDVWCRGLNWNGTALTASSAFTAINTTATTDQQDPAVALCQYKYLVLYADQLLPGANNYDIRGVELGANCATCGNPIHLTGLNGSLTRNVEFRPAVASVYGGGLASDEALVTFSEADDTLPFESSIIAHRYEALGAGGARTILGTICGAGGTIGTAGGPFAVGNTDFRVTVTGVPAGALPFLLIGFPGGEVACGSCTYVNPVSSNFLLPSGSTAAYAYRLPCSTIAFVGVTVQTQWAMFNTTTSPCPAVPTLAFSQRLRLTLGL
ncbi:MAG: hypothetical protein IPK26_11780 [Planctomycetes bacterium]|nr:hypothetical protein [Planctomycetota bacterium]